MCATEVSLTPSLSSPLLSPFASSLSSPLPSSSRSLLALHVAVRGAGLNVGVRAAARVKHVPAAPYALEDAMVGVLWPGV